MRRKIAPTFLSFFLLLLASCMVSAQTEKGALTGVITDGTGAVVPGATVTITNLENNSQVTTKSNDEGLYDAPFLVPATYKVSVGATGFSTAVVSDVVVSVGQKRRLDVQLTAGDVSAQVDVIDTPALLQTESASIGQVITDRQLTQLPTSSRNIYSFLTLDSTVNSGPTGNAEAFRIESGGSLSISGSRPSSVTFKMDGAANNDPTFGTPTITPSIDSVKEFQLQNNAYSAEFEGITQVNVATKSGTGRFHGSLFEFAQNDFFQPRNPNGTLDSQGRRSKNKLKYNQFGGTIGGPIWLPRFGEGGPSLFNKDRTYFFFSYEGLRNNARAIAFTRVLTEAERRGDFSANLGACITVSGVQVPLRNPDGTPSGQCVRAGQIFDPLTTVPNPLFNSAIASSAVTNPQFIRQPFANNQIPLGRLNQNAQALINVQQPLPNVVTASDLNYAAPSGNNFLNNQYSLRIDHKASDNDHVYGRYTAQNNQRDGELVLPFQQKNIVGNGRVINTSWTHSFSPSAVNELRLGYVRGVYGDSVTEIDPTQFGIRNTSLNTLPRIFLSSGGALNFGGFSASVLQTIQNTYQIADNFSYVRGRHSMKFGFKADHNRFKNADFINANGTLQFSGLFSVANSNLEANAGRPNSIADFLLGQANLQSLAATQPAYLSNTPWAVYVQDDWKLSRRLTVTLGLRYELHQPFKEASLGGRTVDFENGGHLIVADPEVARLANSPLVVCCTGPRVVKTDKNDFAPRIGIAYQPFENDNMVFRAGYGIFFADTSQFFHWLYYAPLRGTAIFQPRVSNFTTPAATLSDPFPAGQFLPPGSGLTVSIPTGVNPAAVNNQPVVNAFAIGSYDTPESPQWSAGIQREIWGNMVLDVSYKGSTAKHLPVQWFFNQPSFSATPVNFASTNPAANPYLRRPHSAFTIGSNIVANVLKSNYHAGTVEVDKRFSKGYTFTSTYTWSKSIDQGAEVFTLGQNHAFLPDNHNFDANRGVSAFDVPHRWVTNGIWELPFGKNKRYLNSGGIVNKLVGGWRFAGIFTLQSGLPIQPYVLNRLTNTGISILERGNLALEDPYLSGDEWDAAVRAWQNGARLPFIRPGAIDVNYAPGTGGNIGRNIFRAPYGRRLDLQLAKVTKFGESTSLELRLDVFDVTREVLHLTFINGSVTGAAVLNPANVANGTLGTIPGRNIFFRPHTIQIGARLSF